MNKRQIKKRDKKLYKAIKELNEDILEEQFEFVLTEEMLIETFNKVRANPIYIARTFKAYKKYILDWQ